MTAYRVVDPINAYKDGVYVGTPENIDFIGSNFVLSMVGTTLKVESNIVLSSYDIEPIWNEIPTGSIDSINMIFYLSSVPANKKVMLFLNGTLLEEGIDNDYILTSNSINMMTAPQVGDKLIASYLKVVDVSSFCWTEIPTGLINNSNTYFYLTSVPRSNTLMLFLNGRLLEEGSGKDYILISNEINMLDAPNFGDKLMASYIKVSSASTISFSEVPSGTINETNKDFYLSHIPIQSTFMLFYNGRLLDEGINDDYTLTTDHIVLSSNFQTTFNDKLKVYYEYLP